MRLVYCVLLTLVIIDSVSGAPTGGGAHKGAGAKAKGINAKAKGKGKGKGRGGATKGAELELTAQREAREAARRSREEARGVVLRPNRGILYCAPPGATPVVVPHSGRDDAWGQADLPDVDRSVGVEAHPQGKACAGTWRLIQQPAMLEHKYSWHEALRIAVRDTGRQPLTEAESKALCTLFGCDAVAAPRGLTNYRQLGYLFSASGADTGLPPSPDGLWLEFGVYTGGSLNMTADARRAILKSDGLLGGAATSTFASVAVHGFDSFQGARRTLEHTTTQAMHADV